MKHQGATHRKGIDTCAAVSAHPTHTVTNKGNPTSASYTNGKTKESRHSPASAAEAASWTGTAVRSYEAELEAFAPGAPEVLEAPGAPQGPRAACGAAKGTWRSPDRRSSPQALLVAAAY